jgi:hypothetical protein
MRISFLASFFLLGLSVCSGEHTPLQLHGGLSLTYAADGDQTIFSFQAPGEKATQVAVARDETVARSTAPDAVKVVADVPDSILVLTDSYPSIQGGLSYCQAGEESFLRVFLLSGKHPVETYHTKLESCRNNIELASPGLNWSAETRTIAINWISAPGTVGKSKTMAVKIGADGKATETEPGP